MMDNVSYVQGLAKPLVIIHHPHVSTASLSKVVADSCYRGGETAGDRVPSQQWKPPEELRKKHG